MTTLPPALEEEIGKLLAVLERDTREPRPRLVVLRGALRASLHDGVLSVPASYVDHWNRFQVVPTALVRDVAYSVKKASLRRQGVTRPEAVEADSLAYAEHVLRSVSEGD